MDRVARDARRHARALNYYFTSATAADNLISGPSGWGYGYPNFWLDEGSLSDFAATTNDYALRAGLRVVTVWNTITGGIDPDVGSTFAQNAPSVLGLTAQNTGGGLTIYDGSLPGFALSCNYCTGEQAMKDHIASAAAGWSGAEPRFILIQAQPWQNVTPTSFLNVQNSLDETYAVVRPDNWFQLLRQANGLRIEPHLPITSGQFRLMSEASGKCLAIGVATSGDTPAVQEECADDDRQRWNVAPTDSGYVTIASVVDGRVLDVAGGPGALAEGAPTIVHSDLGGANQQWQPVWEEEEVYHLLTRHSDQCLDVPNGVTDDVQLQQWSCNGSVAQQFRFADPVWPPVIDEPTPPLDPADPPGPGMDPTDPAPVPVDEEEPSGAVPEDLSSGCACTLGTGRDTGDPARALIAWCSAVLLWFGRGARRVRV